MKSTGMSMALKACLLAVAFVLVAESCAVAIPMNKMPKELQTTNLEPEIRTINLKLPLRQPMLTCP